MARPLRRASLVLAAAGAVLVAIGTGAAGVGLFRPDLISSQIPPGFIDTPAVGGATFALGVGLVLLGLTHLITALALRRAVRGAATTAVVLGSIMGVLASLFAVAAVVSAASGSATPTIMLPAACLLLIGAAGYAAVAAWSIGSAAPPN